MCGPSTGTCGDYMGTYDILKQVIGSDLEDEYFGDYIYLVSYRYLLSNSPRPTDVFSYFYGSYSIFIKILVWKKSKLNKLLPL